MKHQQRIRHGRQQAEFPLGKTGGLIEAASARDTIEGLANGGFRWVKPAASLKQGGAGGIGGTPGAGFRWVKPAASLKRNQPDRARRGPAPVSAG